MVGRELVVMRQMMETVLAERIDPKHAKIADKRTGHWHGTTKGPVVLAGRVVTVARPRARTTAGEEIILDSWKVFSSADLLNAP